MIKNSADYLAKQAWDMTRQHWQELILLPVLVGIVFVGLQGFISWAFIGFEELAEGSFVVSPLVVILGLLIDVAGFVFGVSYLAALLKWCEDVHKGKTELDVAEGLRYGLSRFWGTIGTSLLTWIKTMLWTFLLVLPGLYKFVMYSFSVKVSQLEKLSGSDANRISQMLITNSGFIRRIGNWYGIGIISTLIFYLALAVAALLTALFTLLAIPVGIIVGGILFTSIFIFFAVFNIMVNNFHYLAYREENAAELKKMKEALAKA